MPMGRLTFRCIRCRVGGMSKQCSTTRAAAVRICLSGIRQVGMKRELARADVDLALPTDKDRPGRVRDILGHVLDRFGECS